MNLLGYVLMLAGIYFLYVDSLIAGIVLFCIGGFLSKVVTAGLGGIGILLMVMTGSYGYHNEFSLMVTFLFFVGLAMFVYAKFGRGGEWDFDFDIDDFFGGDGDSGGFGGDSGSDGGGDSGD